VLPRHVEHDVHDLFARFGVEVSRGLVGHDQARRRDEGPRDGHPLLLAPRQLAG